MSAYTRNTANLDPERGDKITLKRETIIPLFAPSFPAETRRDIIETALSWFADEPGRPDPHLKDPLADAFVQSIINGQKTAVEKYICKCDQAKSNRSNGMGKGKGDARQPPSTSVNGRLQYKDNDNDNGNDNVSHCQASLSVGEAGRIANAPARSPLSVKEAKRILAMDAPEILSHADCKRTNDKGERSPTVWALNCLRRNADAVSVMIASELHPDDISPEEFDNIEQVDGEDEFFFGDDEREGYESENEGATFALQLTNLAFSLSHKGFGAGVQHKDTPEHKECAKRLDTFKRALVDAYLASQSSEIDNPEAFIIGRLNKVQAAILTLANHPSKSKEKPHGDSDY